MTAPQMRAGVAQKAYRARVTKALKGERGPVHFIDAGITGTGFATWVEMPELRPTRPDDYGCIKGIVKSQPWRDRAYYVTNALADNVFDEYGTRAVVIEWPKPWVGSAKSRAATDSGNLLKMAFLIGQIEFVCRESGWACVLVEPDEWKGNMSKTAVVSRIKRRLGGWSPESHDADAIGMGLVAMGMF